MTEQEKEPEVINIPIDEITRENVFTTDKKGKVIVDKENGPLDSWEEWYFTCYLKELVEIGIIKDADKNVRSIKLSDKQQHISTEIQSKKTKITFRHLFYEHVYTPDFNISWNPEYKDMVFSMLNTGMHIPNNKPPFITSNKSYHSSVIELKANYIKADEVRFVNNDLKWAYDKWGMYIQLVKVPKIFKETFTPKEYIKDMVYKVGNRNKDIQKGDSRLKYAPKTIEKWFELIKDLNPNERYKALK